MNVNGYKQWLHTVGNEKLTHFAIHEKRGRQATIDIGILSSFTGTLVHDHWKSYFFYEDCQHGLCNAHHLRELRFLYEHQNIQWAKKISDLLIAINEKKKSKISAGKDNFSDYYLTKYNKAYDKILKNAAQEQARRGTIESKNLLKRLIEYKDAVLLFMNDFTVPFTNNLSERDLRMNKVKQKVSGCFRNIKGAIHYCSTRSVISTAKKNDKNIFDILHRAFETQISINDLIAT